MIQDQKSTKCHTPQIENTESLNSQNQSEVINMPPLRTESLDEDLDMSDSDDDRSDPVVGENYLEEGPSTHHEDEVRKEIVEADSEDEDEKASGRFNRLKSENKLQETSQLEEDTKAIEKIEDPEIPKPSSGRRFFSQLEELRFHFQSRTSENMAKLQSEREKLSKERSCFAYEAYVDIIKKDFKNLMGCQNEESFSKILNSIASNKNPQNEAMICDLVYEYLKSEHRLTPLLSEQDQDQPAITRKQQRLFVLLTKLAEMPRYQNIMDRILALLWHNLFGRDRMFNLKLNAVQNSGRMFVLCARFSDNVILMKHFIFDLFYFKSPRNHILVGIVIALWPDIFPHRVSPLASTPLAETLAWCVFNTGPAQKSPEMRVQETKDNYVRDYDYKPNAVSADGLVIKFIKMAEENSNNKELLEEVAMCLLLIGRNKEYRWVNNNISARLLKSLASVWGGGGDESVLRWVITTLGILSRVYPAQGREQVISLYNSVEQMLQKGSSLQPETEQACITALLHLGYHLQYQVAQFLKSWQPCHPLKPRVRTLLEDFVGTRGKKHAEITARVSRIEQNKARKRKGVRKKCE